MLNTIAGLLSGGVAPTDYESIQTVTVGGAGAASVDFTSIPSTYSHLQIRAIARSAAAGSSITANTRFYINGDTTSANYTYHRLSGQGSTATAAGGTSLPGAYPGSVTPENGALSNLFAGYVIDILDYANTNKNKTIRSLAGSDANGSGTIWFGSMAWLSTSAITSLSFNIESGSNFAQYSSFALYGIK
jgi:hypothetical protein